MRSILLAGVCLLTLSACASVPGMAGGTTSQLLENLQGCRRLYTGGTGLGAQFSFHIECDPQPAKPAVPDAP